MFDLNRLSQCIHLQFDLIQAAKANDLEPYWYLRYLFEQLPYIVRDTEKLRQLLPMYVAPEVVKKQS